MASGHPRGLATLFFTEMWERFSFYGMRAILVLYMVAAVGGENPGMALDDATATAIYGLYTAAVYLLGLPGGWVADRLIGQQRAVWHGGVLIALGHFSMAVPAAAGFYLGLALISVGTGLLKPNISAIVGDLYPDGGARRDAGFSIFYMGINIGAFIGPLVCGLLGEQFNWHYGFAAAGVGMVLGLIQYRATQRHLGSAGLEPTAYSDDPAIDRRRRRAAWRWLWSGAALLALVIFAGLSGVVQYDPLAIARASTLFIVAVAAAYLLGIVLFGGLTPIEKRRIGVIAVLLIGAATFWSGFEQAGSSLNLFAERHTDRVVAGFAVPASWLQSINPLFIIALAPVFAWLWVQLARRNLDPSIPGKFALGLIQLGLGFGVMAVAARFVIAGDAVLPTWLVLTYLLHTTGELCLSPVGLSAITKLSPRRLVGQMMGIWFVATALGNLLAGLVAGRFDPENLQQMPALFGQVFLVTAGLGVVLLALVKPLGRLADGRD